MLRLLPLALLGPSLVVAAMAAATAVPRGDASRAPGAREALAATPAAASLRAWHELLGSEPHVAGTPGDARQIERLRAAFADMGMEVEVQVIEPLLARPVAASLEIVAAGRDDSGAASPPAPGGRRGVLGLDLRERNLVEDPSTAHPDLSWGWNAYSASGDVTAPVVYANYGTREDFAALRSLGVDPRGAIVLVRYGRNFRGDKVRFAEEAGAAGLVIFSDPADVAKGPAWPEGGWANDTCIQRGSILKKARPGDPLTPGVPATADAWRLPIDEADLPVIPVQPVGYGAAGRILAAMRGAPAPVAWQGGLPVEYRLAGGEGMQLRLHVEQERLPLPTANVVGTLRGASDDDGQGEFVVVGCHHDAWGFGAADPLAGTIVLMETARAFAEAHRTGWRPRRTIRFAAWAAEEFGIIGSTEWCEAHAREIADGCVAYINLDMASMGDRLGASASPSLATVIREAAAVVPQAREPSRKASESWSGGGRSAGEPISLTGGGSDHEAFLFHLGVPSAGLHAGGAAGTSYHSNYDTIAWYRSVVGEDYEPALMVTRTCVELTRRLADDEVVPLDPTAMATFLRRAVADAETAAEAVCAALPRETLDRAIDAFEAAASAATDRCSGPASEGVWLAEDAPRWHRHVLYGPNADAGYSVETLPLLRAAIRTGDQALIDEASARLAATIEAAAPRR